MQGAGKHIHRSNKMSFVFVSHTTGGIILRCEKIYIFGLCNMYQNERHKHKCPTVGTFPNSNRKMASVEHKHMAAHFSSLVHINKHFNKEWKGVS
jgi:hypothetical protein